MANIKGSTAHHCVRNSGKSVPPGFRVIPVGEPINMDRGSPYTPVSHRFFFGAEKEQQITRLLALTVGEEGIPSATFILRSGKSCMMMFTSEGQSSDTIFAKVPKGQRTALAKHVRSILAKRMERNSWTFAKDRSKKATDQVAIPQSLKAGPRAYAVNADGNCLAPHFADGDTLIVDPDQSPAAGDFVAIWRNDGAQPIVKRLVVAIPGGANSGLAPTLAVEMLNPRRTMTIPMDRVSAVHKVLGKTEDDANG